ncbi:hypothetical protein [Pectobacterium wasabiae]|uniref:hypothetical protein n=1 Tax=Pectobacterium wasabiae TaxID=55208 RepID=UPI00068F2FD3|nr:hypothetical protein [Pectobacterium wasabiae]
MSNFVDVLKKKKINHVVNDNAAIVIEGDLSLLGRTDITSLPENLSVGGYLDLEGTGITSLPENLSVGGSLYLRGTGITSLPENLSVGGSLYLRGTGITSLPENLSVGGYLDLEGTGITSLPENLSVGGYLDLEGTGITSLPENFTCDSLYLDPQRFDNVTYRENCGNSSRTIFAAWVQGNFRIAAGCFWDTLDEFESAVDESYSGDAAEAYKQAARDCVADLTEKLNKAGE